MTNKERAKEYAKGKAHEHYHFLFEENNGSPVDFAELCFFDGLTEGKPKWHDLRKNPEDLPPASKEDDAYSEVVLNDDCDKVYCSLLFGTWYNYHTDRVAEVIAWTTLPKFEEE